MKSLKEIVARSNKAGRHLGDVAFFRMREATTLREQIDDLAKKAGYPIGLLPDGMDERSAFRAACKHCRVTGFILRQISDGGDKPIMWGAVKEKADQDAERLDYDFEVLFKIEDHKGAKPIVSEPSHAVAKAWSAIYRKHVGSVSTDQIRMMVKRVCRARSAVPMGSGFFVPAEHRDFLRSLQGLVEALGDSQLWLLPIHEDPDSNQTIDRAVRAGIEEEIVALAEEMEAWDVRTRPSTMERRLQEFDGLRSKANLYAGILKVSFEDLQKKIGRMEQKLQSLIVKGG
jgi:hypothetical protein